MKKNLLFLALIISGLLSTTSVVAQVIANPPIDQVICEVTFDGFAEFDLTLTEPEIIGGQDPTNLVVTYYESQQDVENAINPIVVPESYINVTNPQTIYARIEDSTNGDFDITNFDIRVENYLAYVAVSGFWQCDDEVVDGITEFDLNSQNATITGGNPYLTVTYYWTESNANTSDNPLSIPYTNISNPETIYVRVDGNTGGCYGIFEMELMVITPPNIFQPDPLEYCDYDNDGYGEFNLTDADLQVTGGIPGTLMITYHYTLTDAQNGEMPLSSPYTNDVPYLQTVYVRLLDQSTGCYSTIELELIVNLGPDVVEVTDLVVLDGNNDGFEVFDLTSKIPEILNGQTNVELTFYETLQNAYESTEVIENPSAYTNISNPQTIYVRMDGGKFCFSITDFNLVADPNFGVVEDFYTHLKLYPNPTSEIINIQFDQLTETVAVNLYNLQGQVVLLDHNIPSNGTISIDLSSMNTGVYFIKIASEEGTMVKKIVKL